MACNADGAGDDEDQTELDRILRALCGEAKLSALGSYNPAEAAPDPATKIESSASGATHQDSERAQ